MSKFPTPAPFSKSSGVTAPAGSRAYVRLLLTLAIGCRAWRSAARPAALAALRPTQDQMCHVVNANQEHRSC